VRKNQRRCWSGLSDRAFAESRRSAPSMVNILSIEFPGIRLATGQD
jgi:hypothetical protein